jgi:penicillin G amidase
VPLPRDAGEAARWAAAGVAGAAALAASGAAAVRHQFLHRPLPSYEGRRRVQGLSAPVEIRRDRWGVPHIRAETVEDLWFAQGYCHGQDRLWQMELYRRSSAGRI